MVGVTQAMPFGERELYQQESAVDRDLGIRFQVHDVAPPRRWFCPKQKALTLLGEVAEMRVHLDCLQRAFAVGCCWGDGGER